MAPKGAIHVSNVRELVAVLADHDTIPVAMMPPAAMPAIVAMHAIFRPRVFPTVMMTAALDHDGLGACNRRQRNRNRTKRRDDITKLPHVVLLTQGRD